MPTALPDSKHFQLEPLADGVYAVTPKAGGGAVCNAGLVDLGDGALVFDTLLTPQAARDLCAAAEALTGHPVRVGVNSHRHPDHVFGNQALPARAALVSTATTRALMAKHIPEAMEGNRAYIPEMEGKLSALRAQLATESDADRRQEIADEIAFNAIMLEAIPTLRLRLPDLTFERRLVLHGAARTAELITFGSGHTESDAVLYLPETRIAFVGDLLFHGAHPWLGHGDLDGWLRILDALDALGPEVIVPGHGAVTTPVAFDAIRAYIPALQQLAAEVVAAGGSADDAARMAVPLPFVYLSGESTFQNNMRFLYEQLSSGQTTP